jgi:hypothetical protein
MVEQTGAWIYNDRAYSCKEKAATEAAKILPDMTKYNQGLKCIGAGLGRTGTSSLKASLSIIYGASCYHMTENIRCVLNTCENIASADPFFATNLHHVLFSFMNSMRLQT